MSRKTKWNTYVLAQLDDQQKLLLEGDLIFLFPVCLPLQASLIYLGLSPFKGTVFKISHRNLCWISQKQRNKFFGKIWTRPDVLQALVPLLKATSPLLIFLICLLAKKSVFGRVKRLSLSRQACCSMTWTHQHLSGRPSFQQVCYLEGIQIFLRYLEIRVLGWQLSSF